MEDQNSQQELVDKTGEENENKEVATTSKEEEKDVKTLLEEERKKTKEREEEIERLRQEKLKLKTSSKYIESKRNQEELRRKATILNNQLPNTHRFSDEQLNEMSNADLLRVVREMRQLDENRTTDKFAKLLEGKDAEKKAQTVAEVDKEIQQTRKDFPEAWKKYEDDIIELDDANPEARLGAKQLLILAATNKGDLDTLSKIAGKKETKGSSDKVDKKKDAKAGLGQAPTTTASDTVKSVTKPLSPKEAAAKAYDEAGFGT